MAKDIFDNPYNDGLIARTKLRNKYGRDFVNKTDYFDNLDANGIKFDEMATDLHVMTKTDEGDYVSEPLNVVLSRIKATNSIAKCNTTGNTDLTEAEYAMQNFWFSSMNADIGLHIYVNTETDPTKPKKLEPKFIDLTIEERSAPPGEKEIKKFALHTFTEENLEDSSRRKLENAKAAGRHCDSKGWLSFKKFFSGQATKIRLQKEYDDYQALKVSVAEDEIKYRAAAQSKCDIYSTTEPDKIATIEKETFEANKREVEIYNETEKAINLQLAAKVMAKCADRLPEYEKKHAHYVKALVEYEGFNKHTMGQSQAILGNEKEEAELIKYISQPGAPDKSSRLEKIIAAAEKSYDKDSDMNLDKAENEFVIYEDDLNDNDLEINEDSDYYNKSDGISSALMGVFCQKANCGNLAGKRQLDKLLLNNDVFQKHFKNVPEDKFIDVLKNKEFEAEMYSRENAAIITKACDIMDPLNIYDITHTNAKKALKQAKIEVYKGFEAETADFIANRVLDALTIKNNDKISNETKTAMRNAISSKNVVRCFAKGKTIEAVENMQNDPKKGREYQAVINSVLKLYNPDLFDGKAARPKEVEKKQRNVAPKEKVNGNGIE